MPALSCRDVFVLLLQIQIFTVLKSISPLINSRYKGSGVALEMDV